MFQGTISVENDQLNLNLDLSQFDIQVGEIRTRIESEFPMRAPGECAMEVTIQLLWPEANTGI
jgi:hypothetical protein